MTIQAETAALVRALMHFADGHELQEPARSELRQLKQRAAALTAAAEVGDEENEMAGIAKEYGLDPARDYLNEKLVAATIERCAQAAESNAVAWQKQEYKWAAELIARDIRALKDKP